jgi:Transglycosylase-like domain
LLTKRKQFTLILFALLAFPAAALAAGGGGSSSGPKVGQAEVVPIALLQRPVAHFQRVIHRIAHDIEAEERAEERRARREREEQFAALPGGISASASTLEAIASCESGGNPAAVSSDGTYRGLYQFDSGTWESVGGSGDPAAASAAEQTYRAALLYSRSGSSPWPVCG